MQRLVAAALAALLLAAPGCDLNPEAVVAAAVSEGEAALAAREATRAEKAFREAIRRDPLCAAANLGLGKLYDFYLVDNDKAIQFYSRYIDVLAITDQLEAESANVKFARLRRATLRKIHSGEIEAPETAIEDILNAIDNGNPAALARRLDPTLIAQLAAQRQSAVQFLAAQRELFRGGRPRIVYRDLSANLIVGGLRTTAFWLKGAHGPVAVRLVAASAPSKVAKDTGPEGFWVLEQIQERNERKP